MKEAAYLVVALLTPVIFAHTLPFPNRQAPTMPVRTPALCSDRLGGRHASDELWQFILAVTADRHTAGHSLIAFTTERATAACDWTIMPRLYPKHHVQYCLGASASPASTYPLPARPALPLP